MKNIQECIQQVAQLKGELVSLKKSLGQKKVIALKDIEKIKIKLVALAQNVKPIKTETAKRRKNLTIVSYEGEVKKLNQDFENKKKQHLEEIRIFKTRQKGILGLLGLESLAEELLNGCNYSAFISKHFSSVETPAAPTVTIEIIPSIDESINCDESYVNALFTKIEEFKAHKNLFGFIKLKTKNDNSETFESVLEKCFDSIIEYCDALLRALSSYKQFNNDFNRVNESINNYNKHWESYCKSLARHHNALNGLDVQKYLNEITERNPLLFNFLENIRRVNNFYSQLELYEEVLKDALEPKIFSDFTSKLTAWSNNWSEFLNKIKKHIEENPDDTNKIYIIFNDDLKKIIKEEQILLGDIQKHIPDMSNYRAMLALQKYLINSPSILKGTINNPNSFFSDACPIEELSYKGKKFFEFLLSELEKLNSDILRNIEAISKNIIDQQKKGEFNILKLKECYKNFLLQRSALLGYIAGFSEHICLAYMNRYCQRSKDYNQEKLNNLIEDVDDNDINSRERKYLRDLILFINKNIGLMTGVEILGEDICLEVYMKMIEVFRHMYLIQYNLGWIYYSDNANPRSKYVKPAELSMCLGINRQTNEATDDYKHNVDEAFDVKHMNQNSGSRIGCYPVKDIDEAIACLEEFNSHNDPIKLKTQYLKDDIIKLILYDYFYHGSCEKSGDQYYEQLGMLSSGIWWEKYKHNYGPGNVNYEKLNTLLEQIVDNLYRAQTVCYFFMRSKTELGINDDMYFFLNAEFSRRNPTKMK